jgi:hypothetical protein
MLRRRNVPRGGAAGAQTERAGGARPSLPAAPLVRRAQAAGLPGPWGTPIDGVERTFWEVSSSPSVGPPK